MFVEDRNELRELLQERVSTIQADLLDKPKVEAGKNYLKSYLVEAHDDISKLIQQVGYDITTKKTSDDLLNIQLKLNKKNYYFYVDTINERFPIIHTLADVKISDSLVRKTIKNSHEADNTWFTRQFMLGISEIGELKSFTVKIDRTHFIKYHPYDIERMSIRLWGKAAKKILTMFETNDQVSNSVAITNVGFKYFNTIDDLRTNEYINNYVTFDGRFTAWGASINPHFSLLEKIRQGYTKQIENIEGGNLIDLSLKSDQLGDYYTIDLETPLTDIERFLSVLLNEHGPVRLYGFYQKASRNFYRVTCVDQHINKRIRLEVMNDKIRVYMHDGTCGNTIPRILTLLQHHLESSTGKEEGVVL